MLSHRITTLLLGQVPPLFVLALAFTGCSNDRAGTPAASSSSAVDLEPIYQTLDKIRANMPAPAAFAQTPCPDAQIQTWSPEARARGLSLISYSTLLRTTGSEIPDAAKSAVTGGMNSFEIGWIPARGTPTKPDARLPEKWAASHYLAVLAPTRETVPDAASAIGGRFEPGVFEGWLVVFRKATAEPICSLRVTASSSARTAVTTKVDDRMDDVTRKAQHQVTQDLRRQVGLAIKAAVAQGSQVLTILNPAS